MGQRQRCRLVVAGGYDNRLAENREYLEELKHLTTALQVPVSGTERSPSEAIVNSDPQFPSAGCPMVT